MTELDALLLAGFVVGVLSGCVATWLVLVPSGRSLRRAAVEPAARPPDHRHAWELRSVERTNKRHRGIYVCLACQDREVRDEGPDDDAAGSTGARSLTRGDQR